MNYINSTKASMLIERIKNRDPELAKVLEEKKEIIKAATGKALLSAIAQKTDESAPPADAAILMPEQKVEEAVALAHLRPVLVIRDNKIVPEFLGPDTQVWQDRLMQQESVLNEVIPAVGRIELTNNAVYKWVGTGWLIDTDILITNRHVASVFCQNKEGFAFKVGFPSGSQSADIDFLEEDQRTMALEFDIQSVIWIAPNDNDSPDVSFMRVSAKPNGPTLPKPITLADTVNEGEVVVTIGYPARDPTVPDQDMVLRIFGSVYDKKRLAPGEVIGLGDKEIEHDCSTLGGNSGSPVISLATGKAVGLHFAGLYLHGNFAVPAPKIKELLDQLRKGTLPGMRKPEKTITPTQPFLNPQNVATNQNPNSFTFQANIPIKITVEIGSADLSGQQFQFNTTTVSPVQPQGNQSQADNFHQALQEAKSKLEGKPGIISVEPGYRFRRGWITDEKVIAVEVQEKQSLPDLKAAGKTLIPPEFSGVGVDVRTAGLPEQLAFIGVDLAALEAAPARGAYREPTGLILKHYTQDNIKALFHVSPDNGWPNLKAFFGKVKNHLTATMYEWDVNHISDALFNAIKPQGRTLKMVTQKKGTSDAVEDMQKRLKNRFEHVWASVGSGLIVPTAYHIKVASRDGEAFWLSSGNWKDSNQADIDPADDGTTSITPLRQHNREWHVIIEHEDLAKTFQKFIEWDFEEATRLPLEEAKPLPDIYLFVPESAFEVQSEARILAEYFKPLSVDKVLDIQPLLTPDRNSRGEGMFLAFATDMVEKAKQSIDIENQSFSLLEENEDQFERFFNVLVKKQKSGIPVRVIFRDPREFSAAKGKLALQKTLTRLKDVEFDTDFVKTQKKCHTKAIIVDSADEDNAAVLFGSHNLTTSGALFNRDASLLVRDFEVASYFQKIFDFDWEVLATQSADEEIGGVRIAQPNEETPPGFRKVSLAEFMGEGDS